MRGLALLFTLHFGRAPVASDPWFSADKTKHFLTSAFVQSLSFGVARSTGLNRSQSVTAATVVSGAVAVGKEVYDKRFGGDPSVKDVVWDAAGIAAVSALLLRTQR